MFVIGDFLTYHPSGKLNGVCVAPSLVVYVELFILLFVMLQLRFFCHGIFRFCPKNEFECNMNMFRSLSNFVYKEIKISHLADALDSNLICLKLSVFLPMAGDSCWAPFNNINWSPQNSWKRHLTANNQSINHDTKGRWYQLNCKNRKYQKSCESSVSSIILFNCKFLGSQ